MTRHILSVILALGLSGAAAFAGSATGQDGVYINGNAQPAPGTLTTNTYSKGTGAANSNTVDHAIYADSSGGVAGGMTTNVYANGTGSNNVNKVDHAMFADAAIESDPIF